MKIVFDYQIFSMHHYGGISRYFVELAKAINKETASRSTILAPYSINKYLTENDTNGLVWEIPHKFIKNRYYDCTQEANIRISELYLKVHNVDILHETYYPQLPLKCKKAKRVITIHDMIYEKLAEYLPGAQHILDAKKSALERADFIIAVSENTKKDLIEIYPFVRHKVAVVYHGNALASNFEAGLYQHQKPFLLYVGHRGGYKNFDMLLKVFGQELALSARYDLICFGGGPFTNAEQIQFKKYGLQQKVKLLEGRDSLLRSIYRAASLFVYPSLYEGFGMPILEAMSEGCPVVCSENSSLPEVGGAAALYFNSKEPESILKAIQSVLNNKALSNEMVRKGLERVKLFNWNTCANETMAVYAGLLN